MEYKLYSNITCPNPTEDATENIEERIHLLSKVLNVKHDTP